MYTLTGPEDTTLLFESRFESGNLAQAVKIGPSAYELYLRCDLATTRHTQWFYFAVRNAKAGMMYSFVFCNMSKSHSLYEHGMQPVSYSLILTL